MNSADLYNVHALINWLEDQSGKTLKPDHCQQHIASLKAMMSAVLVAVATAADREDTARASWEHLDQSE